MTTEQIIAKTLESPALKEQSAKEAPFTYPVHWRGKVPLKVKMLQLVRPDIPFLAKKDTVCLYDQEYYVWVNSYGAVSAILPNGELLGLKPDEFEVIEFHQIINHDDK